FQIWSNSLDDLYLLGEEVLNLLNIEKSISSYNNSTPPTVFVKKGNYINGALDLEIVNTNATDGVTFDAGYRTTETSAFDYVTSSIDLNQDYITNVQLETGNLFDIGFRIGDGINTPDDLFMSDGPWGIDDSQASTTVNNYSIFPNENVYDDEDFPIERNLTLNATTSTYFAAYRAITPRFKPVDLTDYNSFKLTAKGTGNLEITFVKQSISNWEAQHKTTIALNDTFQDFAIPFSSFTSSNGTDLVLDDIVTIVFTMVSEDGSSVAKEMNLQNVRFSQTSTLSIDTVEGETNSLSAVPNPMTSSTSIQFSASNTELMQFMVYNQMGQVVYQTYYKAHPGTNKIKLNRQNLNSGLYFCKLTDSQNRYHPLKLLVK
ncbi:MAG: T9SS type A sorting domain-containing protein, partial [Bacteroidia bacterium]|nr:T9SS type A sorting domain-containing protein [Bacteroidia bacterium]